MRISDLRERLTLSFGAQWAPSFCKDIAITELGSKSVDEALQAGFEPHEYGVQFVLLTQMRLLNINKEI